jgi:hypothetical protein
MRVRGVAIAMIAAVAAVGASGCGGGSPFTRSGHFGQVIAINSPITNGLVSKYFSAQCNVDLNHNGTPGGPQDRGYCILDTIRLAAVSSGLVPKSGKLHDYVYEATNHREWDDLNRAIGDVMHQVWDLDRPTCLTVDAYSFVDNQDDVGPPYQAHHINWTFRNQPDDCI